MIDHNPQKLDSLNLAFVKAERRDDRRDTAVVMYQGCGKKEVAILRKLGVFNASPGRRFFREMLTAVEVAALSRLFCVACLFDPGELDSDDAATFA